MMTYPIRVVLNLVPLLMLIACSEGKDNERALDAAPAATGSELRTSFSKDTLTILTQDGTAHRYSTRFMVIYRPEDPELALRPAGLPRASYNVPTWLAMDEADADLAVKARDEATAGDGFDDSILDGNADSRTASYFSSGEVFVVESVSASRDGDVLYLEFPEHGHFNLAATITLSGNLPRLEYTLTAKVEGFYSVGYVGSPEFTQDEVDEIWQPMIWLDHAIPDRSYLTLAFRSPLPTTLVRKGEYTYGLIADPAEFPFDPLPTFQNSRFGIALVNWESELQPMLFAPVLGGVESGMQPGDGFSFSQFLVADHAPDISATYERLAREVYGFGDFRQNFVGSLNLTFQNIVDYSLTEFAWFEKDLKGSAYSTDVPGAVKNVSSLNALELALVTDNEAMFEERAYPTLEYMLSREKFLFSLDPEQKIQNPSRNMFGPIAPVSELTTLYTVLGGGNDFLLDLAAQEFNSSRIRNLDTKESGDRWWNALWLFRATGEQAYLDAAIEGADQYLAERVKKGVSEPAGFFWTHFTPRFSELLELYETTGETRFLEAAHKAARQYTMFTWMAPKVPEGEILVNPEGKAPLYWYLESKGHEQMFAEPEYVDARQLSEIGLTPESSGTSSGHRAIFMANYAPWMLRIGYYTGDQFLQQVAKAAIIGHYRNFPGYHINTARTTIYAKEDYPLRPHLKLSVNSFHYNHILPMASLLLDYLVTDAFVRSDSAITFPSEYIEGYAYLQSKFYGHAPGEFYGESGVNLWMPADLLEIESPELNYISGYRNDQLYIAFMNQSAEHVATRVALNLEQVELGDHVELERWQDNEKAAGSESLAGSELSVNVSPGGLTVIKLSGLKPLTGFESEFLGTVSPVPNDYLEIPAGNARAMLIRAGNFDQRVFVYLRDDDGAVDSATLEYALPDGAIQAIKDSEFPFEFTVDLPDGVADLEFKLSVTDVHGNNIDSGKMTLGR